MNKLNTISLIMGLLFLSQITPVSLFSKAFIKAQLIENFQDNPDNLNENGMEDAFEVKDFFTFYTKGLLHYGSQYNLVIGNIHLSEHLPFNHSADVVYLPPDIR